jgi:hypothetical protein
MSFSDEGLAHKMPRRDIRYKLLMIRMLGAVVEVFLSKQHRAYCKGVKAFTDENRAEIGSDSSRIIMHSVQETILNSQNAGPIACKCTLHRVTSREKIMIRPLGIALAFKLQCNRYAK